MMTSFFKNHLAKKLRMLSIAILFCITYSALGQNKITVNGKVTDENSEPLAGIGIVEHGTSHGTMTDSNGSFSISVAPDSFLDFSCIGYKDLQIEVNNQDFLNVVMKVSYSQLDDAVVVGYGTVKKRDLTGAVSSISSKKLVESPALSAAEAIQGKVPGVLVTNSSWSPGSTPSILIRGVRSLKAGNSPLYVVDGIPISMAPNLISTSEIESIEVLKDASATAIYGSRGANGVILITTKKGRSGSMKVDYNGYFGLQTIQNTLHLMNGSEYADYVREAYRAAGQYDSDTPNIDLDKTLPSFTGDDYTWESIAMAYDENGNYDPSKVRSGALWWKEVERTGTVTEHQLNVSGGSDKINFSFGATYYRNSGVYKQQDYNRYTVKLSIDAKVKDWLRIGAQNHFSHSIQHRGHNFQDCWRVNPLGRLYDDDGNLTLMTSGGDSQWWNPLQYLVHGAVNNPLKINRFLGSYYGEISLPLDGLKYRLNVGLDFHSRQDYSFQSSNARGGNPNYASDSTQQTYAYTIENLILYDKTFGKHTFGLTLLQSIQENRAQSASISVQDLPSDELLYNDVGSASDILGLSSNNQFWSLASFMGRLNYNYQSKYYATVSMRYDGSSRLAEGHKWVAFPAFSLAWRLNEEDFMKDIEKIDNLKIRFGYGVTANTAISPYQTKGLLSQKHYNYGDNLVIGYASSTLPDKSLTWETTGQWNLGIDYSFFHERLSGTIDAYLQNTHKLLLDRQLPVVSGYTSVLTNVGRTRNKGLEFSISSINIQNSNFTWSTDFMYSTNKEEIVELYNGKVDDVGNSWFIGEALGVYYDYNKIGIWQNTTEDLNEMAEFNKNGHKFEPGMIKLEDINGDHKITADYDRKILGQVRPKHIFNLCNTFTYKHFDFNVVLYGTLGGMLRNNIRINHQSYRNNSVKLDYWTPSNPTNKYPRPNRNYDNILYESSLYYEKSDFLRVKTITLGYSIPEKIIDKIGVSNCRLYVTAQNPYVFTDYTGIDPEGATGYAEPSVSSWIFGVNVSF